MVELGNKHECLNCSTKFYDLGKSPLVCPSCGADQAELANEADQGSASKKSKKTASSKKSAKKKAKKKAAAEPKGKGKAAGIDDEASADKS